MDGSFPYIINLGPTWPKTWYLKSPDNAARKTEVELSRSSATDLGWHHLVFGLTGLGWHVVIGLKGIGLHHLIVGLAGLELGH